MVPGPQVAARNQAPPLRFALQPHRALRLDCLDACRAVAGVEIDVLGAAGVIDAPAIHQGAEGEDLARLGDQPAVGRETVAFHFPLLLGVVVDVYRQTSGIANPHPAELARVLAQRLASGDELAAIMIVDLRHAVGEILLLHALHQRVELDHARERREVAVAHHQHVPVGEAGGDVLVELHRRGPFALVAVEPVGLLGIPEEDRGRVAHHRAVIQRVDLQQVEVDQRRDLRGILAHEERGIVHIGDPGVHPPDGALAHHRAIPLARLQHAIAVEVDLVARDAGAGHARFKVAGIGALARVGVHVDRIGRVVLVRLLAHQPGKHGEVVRLRPVVAKPPLGEVAVLAQRHAVFVEILVEREPVAQVAVGAKEVAQLLDLLAVGLDLLHGERGVRLPAPAKALGEVLHVEAREVTRDHVVDAMALHRPPQVWLDVACHHEHVGREALQMWRRGVRDIGEYLGEFRRNRDQNALAQVIAPAIGEGVILGAGHQRHPVSPLRDHAVDAAAVGVVPVRVHRDKDVAAAGDERAGAHAVGEVGHGDGARFRQSHHAPEAEPGGRAARAARAGHIHDEGGAPKGIGGLPRGALLPTRGEPAVCQLRGDKFRRACPRAARGLMLQLAAGHRLEPGPVVPACSDALEQTLGGIHAVLQHAGRRAAGEERARVGCFHLRLHATGRRGEHPIIRDRESRLGGPRVGRERLAVARVEGEGFQGEPARLLGPAHVDLQPGEAHREARAGKRLAL